MCQETRGWRWGCRPPLPSELWPSEAPQALFRMQPAEQVWWHAPWIPLRLTPTSTALLSALQTMLVWPNSGTWTATSTAPLWTRGHSAAGHTHAPSVRGGAANRELVARWAWRSLLAHAAPCGCRNLSSSSSDVSVPFRQSSFHWCLGGNTANNLWASSKLEIHLIFEICNM